MKKHYRKENNCANCNTELQGKFCHACGQENLELKENFGHMMNHAISDYFHFDHQFFHTLKPLLFQPGKLTNEYIAGRRVQYLHPVKMYIFISLVYFLLLFKSGFEPIRVNQEITTTNGTKKETAATQKTLDSIINDPNVPAIAKIAAENGKKEIENEKAGSKKIEHLPGASRDSSYAIYLANQRKLPANKRDGFIMKIYNKKAYYYREKYGERAKEVYFEEIKHNIPKMMFVLLPLCALIFKLAFWNNKKFYVEHLIFTFHLHCFIFLYLAIIMLLQMATPDGWILEKWLGFAGFIGINWYVYRSFRVFYKRTRWRAVSKMIGVSLMYLTMFSICITIVSLLTALAI